MDHSALNPNKQRLDYGEQLIAPDGYQLTAAVATTYSLDLNTLLTVPVAMCFGHTLEGPIEQQRIALLEALGQLKGCLKVFYQHGNIKIPSNYNSLFTLLEPCLAPVVPQVNEAENGSTESAFSSFHPKVWLLRFEGQVEEPVRYRLIVLSRNLTFDRSWDLAAVIDGYIKPTKRRQNNPLVAFFESLFELDVQAVDSHQQSHFSHQETLLKELPYVCWKKPDGFGDIGFLSTIFDEKSQKRQKPVSFQHHDNQAMLVVSPFLKGGCDIKGLDWLATHCLDGARYLFSRAEELNAMGQEQLSDWQCFALNDCVVNGEEAMELDKTEFVEHDQNLHAKLIVHDQDDTRSVWHLGSANATAAALGTADKAPRNTEFMLQLKGPKEKVGVGSLLNQWVHDDGFGLFVKHEFSELDTDTSSENENALRLFMHQILNTHWQLTASPDQNATYTLALAADNKPSTDDFTVRVSPLAAEQFKGLVQDLCWHSLKLSQISALMRFEIVKGSETKQQFILQLPLTIEGDTDRESEVLKELVHSQSQFYSYLSMLLQLQPDKSLFYGSSDGNGVGELEEQGMIPENAIIYEKLMLAAAKRPESLKRIDMLQKRLDESVIPQAFKELWQVFQPFSQ
ncbi:phospholipase D family protein [Vibrio parahaemolyticus]|uniref:phospholipase D family protein n=1 Tax=Vibrio parahaemolyticus TaxID=670 RepID=UPI0006A5DC56|nr:phospholipase D family protein [Vibrio parahaemolyticus]EGQ8947282.1 hypothetical protein [Vibrio parahaemolyticus]EGR3007730.1 hypothetical protein [Vibrio parahaemolyticus]EGR3145174.1 hypothetical protein [Vibrio parahaemolyticus]EGR3184109.1 hypothetical protein [Vibrio parahaemolyticus]EGR3198503.1 hypothetical protein [Vibrio parahaemolyticus]